MPSIWPRASTCHGASDDRVNKQNFKLEEPAFKTRTIEVMTIFYDFDRRA